MLTIIIINHIVLISNYFFLADLDAELVFLNFLNERTDTCFFLLGDLDNFGDLNIFSRIILHLLFIPIVSGLGYEFLKISARNSDKMFFKFLTKPGIWLQYITTKKPTDNQVEVAIYALKKAFGDNLNDYIGKEYKAEAIS